MPAGATKAKVLAEYERLKPKIDGPALDGAPPPVDSVHKTMPLWKTGERARVDGWLEARGLWRHELFARVVQAPIELAQAGSEERAIPESVQNRLRARAGPAAPQSQPPLQGLPPRSGLRYRRAPSCGSRSVDRDGQCATSVTTNTSSRGSAAAAARFARRT